MSHGNINVGGSPNANGTMAVPYASQLKSNHPSRSPAPARTRKCEPFFRSQAMPEGMNLHVKSPVPQTLVYTLPRKDSNPDEVLTQILNTYTYVDSFHHRTFPTSVQFFITVDDTLHYETIRKHQGLTINGRTYAPCVPVHTSVDLWRVNYRSVPPEITAEQFINAFEPYGIIAEIGRYYYTLANNPCKLYTWDGYVMLQGNMGKDEQPVKRVPVPETIDFGKGIFANTKTATNTPSTLNNTTSNSNTNTNTKTDNTRPAPNVSTPKPQPRMKGHKRNGKKRLKAGQQDSAMEGVISTNTTDDHHQQEAHRTGALNADNTAGTQSEASPTWLAEHASTSAVKDGIHHALAPHESGTSTGSTNSLLPSLHSLNASSGGEQLFYDAVEDPTSDNTQDSVYAVTQDVAKPRTTHIHRSCLCLIIVLAYFTLLHHGTVLNYSTTIHYYPGIRDPEVFTANSAPAPPQTSVDSVR